MATDHHKALRYASAGMWEKAHGLVQSSDDRISCLIHAYLHRVEGDLANARYWYRRAQELMPDNTLEDELSRLQALVAGRD